MATDRILISAEDFTEYESIQADSLEVLKHAREAQLFDLTTVINKELIADCQDNMNEARNQTLLDYIRPVLCYYSYARYILNKNAVDTPFGLVQKTNEFSTPTPEKTIARLAEQARMTAQAYGRLLVEFLNKNKTTYTLWKSGDCATATKFSSNVVISNVNTKD